MLIKCPYCEEIFDSTDAKTKAAFSSQKYCPMCRKVFALQMTPLAKVLFPLFFSIGLVATLVGKNAYIFLVMTAVVGLVLMLAFMQKLFKAVTCEHI